jgi:cathepsin A (carboxypeptidase C)
VAEAFGQNLDEFRPTYHYVAALLDRGVKALIYAGKYDWICNFVGNEQWTLALEWSGKEDFVKQGLREWIVNGKTAGMTRSAKGLTFATIDGAGHMASLSFLKVGCSDEHLFFGGYRSLMTNRKRLWSLSTGG